MALQAFQIQEFNGNRLRFQTGSKFVIDKALMNRPKPAFAQKITGREVLGNDPELRQCEYMQVGSDERGREILREC